MIHTDKTVFPTVLIVGMMIIAMLLLGLTTGVSAQAGELLLNPGFEDVDESGFPATWSGRGHVVSRPFETGEMTLTSEAARTGRYGVKMVHETTKTGNYWLSQSVFVEGGKEYEVSAWVKSQLNGNGRSAIKMEFRDANGRPIGKDAGGELQKDWHDSALEWEQQSFRFVAPLNAHRATVLVRLYSPGLAYFDDVSLKMVDDGLGGLDLSWAADPQAVEEVLRGERQEANVAWWGFDPEDSTEYMQAAISSGVPRVIIPNVGRDWVIRPVTLRSDLELILEEGAVVAAKKGEFRGRHDSLFSGRDIENLKIIGYGATLRMHKDDYDNPNLYEKAEWRMGIAIRGSKNVEIAGLTIRDTGGDGIYLGRGSRLLHNENVTIRDLVADNNYRQGISVITARNLLIEDSIFINTGGTPPAAGVDLEPNQPDEVLENIVIRNSVFDANEGPGIHMYLRNLGKDSNVSILWENVLVRGSTTGINVHLGNNVDPDDLPGGTVTIRNCIVENSTVSGIAVRSKDGDDMQVRFENCIIRDVAPNPPQFTGNLTRAVPIWLDAQSWLGGVHFDNVVVVDSMDRPVLYAGVREHVEGTGSEIRDVTGQIDVVNPYGGTVIAWDEGAMNMELQAVARPSVTIAYDEVVTLPDYQLPSIEVKAGPAVRVSNVASFVYPPTVVQGKFVPVIETVNLDVNDVEHVEVYLGDQVIYSGAGVPDAQSLTIDTRTLFDDRHQLEIVIRTKNGDEVRGMAFFQTQNFYHLMDAIEGPREVAWFGAVYNPIVVEQSDGWQYVTDHSADFLGDGTRKRRAGNTTEYLVWETPDLWDATFDLYAKSPAIEDVVVVEGSSDGQSWQTLSYTVNQAGESPAGWNKLVVKSVSRGGDGDVGSDAEGLPGDGKTFKFVRLVFKQTETVQDIHLGRAFFRMLRR